MLARKSSNKIFPWNSKTSLWVQSKSTHPTLSQILWYSATTNFKTTEDHINILLPQSHDAVFLKYNSGYRMQPTDAFNNHQQAECNKVDNTQNTPRQRTQESIQADLSSTLTQISKHAQYHKIKYNITFDTSKSWIISAHCKFPSQSWSWTAIYCSTIIHLTSNSPS